MSNYDDNTFDNFNDPIQYFADSAFQWGRLQALRYDPKRVDVFPGPSYLVHLWQRCQQSGHGRLGPQGILPQLFCGMRDISCEAIVNYLSHTPVIVVGEWRQRIQWLCKTCNETYPNLLVAEETHAYKDHKADTEMEPDEQARRNFHPLGLTFPSNGVAVAAVEHQPDNPNALFAGYGFFDDAWGRPQQTVLMYLGLAYLFHEFKLAVIHGTRYHDNHLTARWCEKFGFKEVGGLSHNLYRHDTGLLGPSMVSSLTREDFSTLLRQTLIDATSTS